MKARLAIVVVTALTIAASAVAQPPAPAPTPQPGTPRTPPATAPRTQTPRPRAEQTPPEPPPPPPVAGPVARRQGQPVNIKVEFTITDQRGNAAPIKRTVTVIVADAHTGMIRSQSEVSTIGPVPLNIDTSPELLNDGKIRLGFNVQYDWPAPVDPATAREPGATRGTVLKTTLHDSVSLILESGKPMIAAQSADPIGDRQVTVEVKATVLK